ncbi:MAG: ATP-grasp domain-containing protein [Bacillota bacterium]
MKKNTKVLVAATTPDYVEIILNNCHGKALFVTDAALRSVALEPRPRADEELLCELSDVEAVIAALIRHQTVYQQQLTGVTAFDCESLPLAATIAERFSLPFASPQAVENCRDKLRCKQLWRQAGLLTPQSAPVLKLSAAVEFCCSQTGGCVVKPRFGTGSAWTYYCADAEIAAQKWTLVNDRLQQRNVGRLAAEIEAGIIAEEYIDAEEYSADIAISRGAIRIIRLTRKLKIADALFGTTTAYELLNKLPEGISERQLNATIFSGLEALGVDNALCMVDLFIKNGRIILLETAPRLGGDCLPYIIRHATGQDVLAKALDFATDQSTAFEDWTVAKPHVGVRLLADKSGIFQSVDVSKLQHDESICEIELYRKPGHKIILPPADYDSRVLGHIIAKTSGGSAVRQQVDSILNRVQIKISNG